MNDEQKQVPDGGHNCSLHYYHSTTWNEMANGEVVIKGPSGIQFDTTIDQINTVIPLFQR